MALYSFSPMEPVGMPMTSAATPDFQARPMATERDEARLGSRAGSSMVRSRFHRGM